MTSLQGKPAKRIAFCAVFAAFGMILSYLEFLLPLQVWIPLPGFKLGLANVALLLSFFLLSPIDALFVSAVRILLMGLLFGNVTSLYFSVLGGIFAYIALLFGAKWKDKISFFGLSVLMASAHNLGQMLAAASLFGFAILRSYLPILLVAGVIFGGINGWIVNLIFPKIRSEMQRRQVG